MTTYEITYTFNGETINALSTDTKTFARNIFNILKKNGMRPVCKWYNENGDCIRTIIG